MKNNTKIYIASRDLPLRTAIVDIVCITAANAKAR